MEPAAPFLSVCFLGLLLLSTPALAQQTDVYTTPPANADEELRRAIQTSGGSEAQLVVILEDFLKKYPASERRVEIEGEIYKLAVKLRDRNRAIIYGEKLVAGDADNIEALTNLVTTLRERRGEGDLNRALQYADQLVKQFDLLMNTAVKPKRISAARWQERKEQGIASVYLLRGKVQADLGNNDKAVADLQKSFKSHKLAGAAIALGELAERRKNLDEAIDYYAQGFVIALNTDEEIQMKMVRAKLGQLHTAKFKSEAGLGDRILKAHDAFVKEREERLAKIERPNINEGLGDTMLFTLSRLDGSQFRLGDHRGKVIVINFWATWCGPCLTEMPLFEKTLAKYKDDKNVVFLAVSTDEDRELVTPFLRQHKFNLPAAYAEYLDYHFMINSIPTTIILDRNGQVSFRQAGFNPREDFVASLSERIEEAKKK
ncbi:MAG: redoxin family protein [Blastocatellia bacterium]